MQTAKTALFFQIAERIKLEEYFYLILRTNNMTTSGLYAVINNSVDYLNETVDIFREFSDEMSDIIKDTGVSIIYKYNSDNVQIKSVPHFNPELYKPDLLELVIFQEFGLKPQKKERIDILAESIKKEKIKKTLVYACYINNTEEILSRAKDAKKTPLNKTLRNVGTPLGLTAENDNLVGFTSIAEEGADINKKSLGLSPLQLAFKHSKEIARYIFNHHRAAFDKEFLKKGFYIAADCEDREILELLKNIGGDLESYDEHFPHIHNFTDRNNITGIQFCLDNGIDINLRDKQNRTALGKAIMRGYQESIEFLKLHGGIE